MKRFGSGSRLAGALVAWLVGGGPRAWAVEEAVVDSAKPAPPPVVLEIAAGDARDSDALAQVARELLGRLSIEVRATQVARIDVAAIAAPPRAAATGNEPLAHVWIDWRATGRATLYLLDARHDRLLVRQVERPAGGEELAREELAHILETACEGLLAGGEVGVPRAHLQPLLAPPPRPPTAVVTAPPPASAPSAPRWQVALLYEVGALAGGAPVAHGPALSAFVGGREGAPRFGAWATAQLRLPVHATDQNVGVTLQSWAFRALAAYERPLSPRAAWRVGLGGGVDVTRATPETTTPERAVLDDARTLAFVVGRAAAAVDLRVSARLAFVAALSADVDVTGQRYVFARGAGEEVVVRPWVVRPGVAVGVAFP